MCGATPLSDHLLTQRAEESIAQHENKDLYFAAWMAYILRRAQAILILFLHSLMDTSMQHGSVAAHICKPLYLQSTHGHRPAGKL